MLLLVVPGIMTGMLVPKVASPVLKAASLAKGPGMTGLQDMSIIGRALLSSFADIAEDGMMTGIVVPKVASLVLLDEDRKAKRSFGHNEIWGSSHRADKYSDRVRARHVELVVARVLRARERERRVRGRE